MSDSLKEKKQQPKPCLFAIQLVLPEIAIAGTALSPANYGRIVQGGLQEAVAP